MTTNATTSETQGSKPSLLSQMPKDLPLDFWKKITNDFSDERKLDEGAFGIVYKGIMEDGEEIAVKKLGENSPVPRDKAFNNEVLNIMALKHENVVELVGYCHEAQKKVVLNNGRYIVADIVESLLCYEHLPKGSLKKNLFEVQDKMDWDTRFKIIKGICQLFLHGINIVHMDLKPENILLDDNMVAKIADFDLSRLFGQEQTRMNTQNVVGSYGYIAPEYLYRGEISNKSDMYSLGLLILETTTGEKNCPSKEPSAEQFIKNEMLPDLNFRPEDIEEEIPEEAINEEETNIQPAGQEMLPDLYFSSTREMLGLNFSHADMEEANHEEETSQQAVGETLLDLNLSLQMLDLTFCPDEDIEEEAIEDEASDDEEETNVLLHEEDMVIKKTAVNLSDKQIFAVYFVLKVIQSRDGHIQLEDKVLIATLLDTSVRTVERIWKDANEQIARGEEVDVSSKKKGRVGRKRKNLELSRISTIPLNRRRTIRSLSRSLGVPRSTLHRRFQWGDLRRNTSTLNPLLKPANKIARLKFCVSMLDENWITSPHPYFKDMTNMVHIDEKWFDMTRKKNTYYLDLEEPDPVRTVQNTNLCFFSSLQSLTDCRAPKDIRELIEAVEEEYQNYEVDTLFKSFLTLQSVLREVMKHKGGNDYKIPHMGKDQRLNEGRLPIYLHCEAQLVEQTLALIEQG